MLVMGIVNVTPDSFSDGGAYFRPNEAIDHGVGLVDAGADIVDVGGESTRPGSVPVGADEELRRVLPVIGALARRGICVSVDTTKAVVAAAALDAGASIVNDVSAGTNDDAMLEVAARRRSGVVLMHMAGRPKTMQVTPSYCDVVDDVRTYLGERIAAARLAGVRSEAVAVDPGIGFGKTLEHNLDLIAHLDAFACLGCPVLVGSSRKSMFGKLLDLDVTQRDEATLATSVWSGLTGASIVRVHDVAATHQAMQVTDAVSSVLDLV